MKIIERIHKWRYERMAVDGEKPTFVPLRCDELLSIQSDYVPMIPDPRATRNEVFAMEPFLTPYAEEMRVRQISMERVGYMTEVQSDHFALSYRAFSDEHLRRRLETMVCTDTTHIDVTLEWDTWARWKRWLRLTRWFPVKTRTVRIDGRVLYPYLKVSLSQNRHHVQFAIR